MRLIELSFNDSPLVERVLTAVQRSEPLDVFLSEPNTRGRRVLRLVFPDGEGQSAIDALAGLFEGEADWRLIVLPVEASLPKPAEKVIEASQKRRFLALREEVYADVAAGAKLHRDFLLLTVLSTIVAVFGLLADNVAVVIGAMVIAPLLGPILAFAFASALGDLDLMLRSARTALAGLLLGFSVSVLIGIGFGADMGSGELSSRTVVGPDSAALALASGAAAALSIATGLSSTLVGVMVAVALLPPAAATGLLLGAGEGTLAFRAGLLLFINVVSVNLAALLVFYTKGIRPRTWLERRSAKRSVYINLAVWAALIIALTSLAVFLSSQPVVSPVSTP
ncbi:TIGR00341 family protein [Maricaulis sp. CAU 1757]